jgi:hypothetical protein
MREETVAQTSGLLLRSKSKCEHEVPMNAGCGTVTCSWNVRFDRRLSIIVLG